MGCGSSSGVVEPSSLGSNTDNKQGKENGTNHIRGDRISMVEARQRREEESKERRQSLSSLAPDEINKARRNSSRSSSGGSSAHTPAVNSSFKAFPEEDDTLQNSNIANGGSTIKNANMKNGSTKHYNPINISPERNNIQTIEKSYEIEKAIEKNEKQSGDLIILENGKDDEDVLRNNANILVDNIMFTATEKYNKEKSNEPQFTNTRIINVSPLANSHEFIDSLTLKNNANNLVSNIMASALTQVESDKIKTNNTYLPERTLSAQSNTYSVSSSTMDENARTLVNDVLSKAMFQINTEGDLT